MNTFLNSPQKLMLWYSLEAPSNKYPPHMFLLRLKKNINTFWMKKAFYLELCVFE